MRTHVEFHSDSFPALPGEEEQINPGRWGKVLADFLRAELNTRGLSGGDPYAEDWGWGVPIDNPEFPLWIGCGNLDGDDEGFLCFIEPSTPYVRRFLRKIDVRARVEQVAAALEQALLESHKVRDLTWVSEGGSGT